MTTKIEVTGRLTRKPELRVTPAGTSALRLEVDCGEPGDRLLIEVVIAGAAVSEEARQFREGERIHAIGALRALPLAARRTSKLGVEVVAHQLAAAGRAGAHR